jgi:hypothetical protein
MAGGALLTLMAVLLIGAPSALYLGWRGRFRRSLDLLMVMAAMSIFGFTIPYWYQWTFEEGETMIGLWVVGGGGLLATLLVGVLAYLSFLLGERRRAALEATQTEENPE